MTTTQEHDDPWGEDPFGEAPVDKYAHTCCPPQEEFEEPDWLTALRLEGQIEDDHRLALAYLATKQQYPTSPEHHVWQWAEDRARGERLMDVHAEREARGELLPLRDGATDVDLEGIQIEITLEKGDDGRMHKVGTYRYRGEDFGLVRDDLEHKLLLQRPIVEAAHEMEHVAFRVEYCALCDLRAHGMGPDELADSDGSLMKISRERSDACLRRHLWLAGKLPVPRLPEVAQPYLTLSELRAMDPAGYLVEGVLPAEGIGILRARDGMGKTFLALDLALTVASGKWDWHGRDVDAPDEARVVYDMGEGAGGAPKRVDAWISHHDGDEEEIDRNLMVYPGSVNLFSGTGFDRLYRTVNELKPPLVVLDTWATHTSGSDENSNSDTSVIYERLRSLQRASGGCVLVLAHTGKSDKDARGASAIEDNADFVLHVREWEAPGGMKVEVAKMKDGELGILTLSVLRAGESLVLDKAGAAPASLWDSKGPRNLIRTALKLSTALGPRTRMEIEDGIDPKDRPGRTKLYELLNQMVQDGEVLLTKTGQTNRYTLNPAWIDPLTNSNPDPLED